MLGWFQSPGGPTLSELLLQSLCSLEGGYDRLAGKFDASVFRTPDPIVQALRAQIPECQRALDVGCGTGAVLEQFQGRVQQRVGLDLSRNMLARARHNLGPEVELWQGDFLKTHWENHFDLITSVGVLGHIPPEKQAEFFHQVARALRPGGCFLTVLSSLRGRPLVYLAALAFDTAMRVRNLVWRPRFVMYYLSCTLPGALQVMRAAGLEPEVHPGHFPPPYSQLQIVKAFRPQNA
jgi:SAM-dependent methyltransferase